MWFLYFVDILDDDEGRKVDPCHPSALAENGMIGPTAANRIAGAPVFTEKKKKPRACLTRKRLNSAVRVRQIKCASRAVNYSAKDLSNMTLLERGTVWLPVLWFALCVSTQHVGV
jgi:hypothetical protein